MQAYSVLKSELISTYQSSEDNGLSTSQIEVNSKKYGKNMLTKKKNKPLYKKIFESLREPMMLILLFSFCLAFGVNLGKYFKSGEGDFAECFGILFAVILSISINLIMEGSSEKAFKKLGSLYEKIQVKVIRNGNIVIISQENITVGDILLLESGDKICADGRILESNNFSVDESCLTGESNHVKKNADETFSESTPLAERKNMVYSGSFVTNGNAKIIVTAVGDKSEIGKIAGELKGQNVTTPLNQKLNKLGKVITIIGVICAVFVFILSCVRYAILGKLNFTCIQDLFIDCIVLIVAAVPEGLPTIVAVSLALNMIKLAGENALIKKMTATETAGAVSIICTDKTGTLTKNKMEVVSLCKSKICQDEKAKIPEYIIENFVLNSTAYLLKKQGEIIDNGSATECALLHFILKNNKNFNFTSYKNQYTIISQELFDSVKKVMKTKVKLKTGETKLLIKGAPESVLKLCRITGERLNEIDREMKVHEEKERRILAFAHSNSGEEDDLIYDGFVSLYDAIREDVFDAVKDCKRAGIEIKILTGDNKNTAYAVGKELKICDKEYQVINATDIEKLDDEELKKLLPKIKVIARSTPLCKLRVVKILKSMGQVVAVTGDGINDAPAIKNADVGFAMGKSGSEITKESADIVLLDDGFKSVVKSISFGRNVYRNLQRFIIFQLSVNLSSLLIVMVTAILGLKAPFNTFQLLWINVIMDGPPALTLGLGKADDSLMEIQPIKRDAHIINLKMLLLIIISGLYIGIIVLLEYIFNFLGVLENEKKGVVFSLFIMFQLFNAFNATATGSDSIIKSIKNNKIMLITFIITFLIQLIIVNFFGGIFGIEKISLISWIKIFLLSMSIILVMEVTKIIYRSRIKGNFNKKHINLKIINKKITGA